MRIRQLKPAYWADALLQKQLTAASREFYVGLWMLADDGGWFRWDVAEVAAELYRYAPTTRRESDARKYMERLQILGRVQILPCGHRQVPTLVRHQRFSAETKRVYTIRDEHHHRCLDATLPQVPAGNREAPTLLDRNGSERPEEWNESDGLSTDKTLMELRRMLEDPQAAEPVKRAARRALASHDSPR